jgi:N-acetylmuramoyl-L-alanine amidase
MPAVLIELAYITNYEDAILLSEEPYSFAYAIYAGLLNYFGFA